MRTTVLFLVTLALLAAVIAVETTNTTDDDKVKPLGKGFVYEILNVLDKGALTVDSRSKEGVPVFSRSYNGTAGQKWKLHEPLIKVLSKRSFRLSPTSNEHAELDLDKNTLGIWGRLVSAGSHRYWYLNPVDGGNIQIQNYHKTNLCLTSAGLDKEVIVADCENTPSQQWQFTVL